MPQIYKNFLQYYTANLFSSRVKGYAILLVACLLFYPGGIRAQKYEELAQTPPMGWNSWNSFRCEISEQIVVETIDAMVEKGLDVAGYNYVVIDDCWQESRDENGNLVVDSDRFPNGIKYLADYAHSKGLKLGLYSDAGTKTCQGLPGSRGHEYQDARTFASWGIDYLKYDWCYHGKQNAEASYTVMSEALKRSGRPIIFSICEWGTTEPWKWAKNVGHLWRIGGDIRPCWECTGERACWGIMKIVDKVSSKQLSKFSGPGKWNDMDMLEVGHPTLSLEESRSHFGLWSMMASPLMLGNDLRKVTPETLSIITNKEIISINQDPAGKQAYRYRDFGDTEIYRKHLSPNGDKRRDAFLLLNRGKEEEEISIYFDDNVQVREVWNKKDISIVGGNSLSYRVKPHDSVVLLVEGLKFKN